MHCSYTLFNVPASTNQLHETTLKSEQSNTPTSMEKAKMDESTLKSEQSNTLTSMDKMDKMDFHGQDQDGQINTEMQIVINININKNKNKT